MTTETVHHAILSFLADHNPGTSLPDLGLDENLLERKLLTSMDFIELIQVLEEASGISVDFTKVDPATLVTLRGLMAAFSPAPAV